MSPSATAHPTVRDGYLIWWCNACHSLKHYLMPLTVVRVRNVMRSGKISVKRTAHRTHKEIFKYNLTIYMSIMNFHLDSDNVCISGFRSWISIQTPRRHSSCRNHEECLKSKGWQSKTAGWQSDLSIATQHAVIGVPPLQPVYLCMPSCS